MERRGKTGMENIPLILTGPPGCGKSYWIQKYAESVNKELFVCPCRKDRTLREGRQKLHVWARRTEPAILWLEGADDLTPEAQAFLRRILETHAHDVQFILECRDAGRLQEPIRSRCHIQRCFKPEWSSLESYLKEKYALTPDDRLEIRSYLSENEYSYRRVQQCATLLLFSPVEWKGVIAHGKREKEAMRNLSSDHMTTYLREGYHPEHLLHPLLSSSGVLKDYGRCIEVSGSAWAFLGSALDARSTTPAKQEE